MKRGLRFFTALVLCTLMSGCELICQAGTGTCGMSREQAHQLLHPKAYGEYWTKPGMSTESWRLDWVGCGGRSNGQFSGDAPTGSTTKVILTSQEQARNKLDACMQSKGYEYRDSGP